MYSPQHERNPSLTFDPGVQVLWRDPREGGANWRHLTQLPAKSFNQCVAVMDGFLYVAGGEDQNDARNQAKHAVSTLSRYEDSGHIRYLAVTEEGKFPPPLLPHSE